MILDLLAAVAVLWSSGSADAESVRQSLQTDTDIHTMESVVTIQGEKYRRIEYLSETFYVRLLGHGKSGQDLELLCKDDVPLLSQDLVAAEKKITKRVSAFVEFLTVSCQEKTPGRQVFAPDQLAKSMNLGVSIGSKKPGSTQTRLWWSPMNNLIGATVDF